MSLGGLAGPESRASTVLLIVVIVATIGALVSRIGRPLLTVILLLASIAGFAVAIRVARTIPASTAWGSVHTGPGPWVCACGAAVVALGATVVLREILAMGRGGELARDFAGAHSGSPPFWVSSWGLDFRSADWPCRRAGMGSRCIAAGILGVVDHRLIVDDVGEGAIRAFDLAEGGRADPVEVAAEGRVFDAVLGDAALW